MLLLYMDNKIMYLMHISLDDIKCLRSQYGKTFPNLEGNESVIQYIFTLIQKGYFVVKTLV